MSHNFAESQSEIPVHPQSPDQNLRIFSNELPQQPSTDPLDWIPPADPASIEEQVFPWKLKEGGQSFRPDKNPDFANQIDSEAYERYYKDQKVSIEGNQMLRSIAYVFDLEERKVIDAKDAKDVDFEPMIAGESFADFVKKIDTAITDIREYNTIIDYIEHRRDQLLQVGQLITQANEMGFEIPTVKELKSRPKR